MRIVLFATAVFLAFSTVKAKAQCFSSTCIDGQIIATANTAYVADDPIDTHFQYLDPAADCSTAMFQTGVWTYKWHAAGRLGNWVNGPDYFCMLPGCTLESDVTTTTTPGTGGAPSTTTRQIENHRCE